MSCTFSRYPAAPPAGAAPGRVGGEEAVAHHLAGRAQGAGKRQHQHHLAVQGAAVGVGRWRLPRRQRVAAVGKQARRADAAFGQGGIDPGLERLVHGQPGTGPVQGLHVGRRQHRRQLAGHLRMFGTFQVLQQPGTLAGHGQDVLAPLESARAQLVESWPQRLGHALDRHGEQVQGGICPSVGQGDLGQQQFQTQLPGLAQLAGAQRPGGTAHTLDVAVLAMAFGGAAGAGNRARQPDGRPRR